MAKPLKQIVVRGGGHNSPQKMWDYLLSLASTKQPKVLYIGTAGGDSPYWTLAMFRAIIAAGGIPTLLSFFEPVPRDLEAHLQKFDIIYVGGGNTRSMLAVWREWGLDKALRKAYDKGIVLGGVSAGGLCWFKQGTSDFHEGPLSVIDNGLGFLPYSHCPHYDGEALRRPTYQQLVAKGKVGTGYAVDDAAAAHFIDGKLHKAVTLTAGKTVYKVSKAKGKAVEEALPAVVL